MPSTAPPALSRACRRARGRVRGRGWTGQVGAWLAARAAPEMIGLPQRTAGCRTRKPGRWSQGPRCARGLGRGRRRRRGQRQRRGSGALETRACSLRPAGPAGPGARRQRAPGVPAARPAAARLVNRDGADGHGAVAHDPLARLVDVGACAARGGEGGRGRGPERGLEGENRSGRRGVRGGRRRPFDKTPLTRNPPRPHPWIGPSPCRPPITFKP
jgi:hypothetical protein